MSVSQFRFGAVALKSPLDEIIVDRRAGLEPGPAPAVDDGKDAILRTQAPDPAFTGHRAVAHHDDPAFGYRFIADKINALAIGLSENSLGRIYCKSARLEWLAVNWW
jgi:hypothetical protein